jgi:hypothetical protein
MAEGKMAKAAADMGPVIRAVRQTGQYIETLHDAISDVQEAVSQTNQSIQSVLTEIGRLTAAFDSYALSLQQGKRCETAVTRLEAIRRELVFSFGAYEKTRALSVDALQLLRDGDTDAAKARLCEIEDTASGNIAPEYWLAQCLAALFAWLGDRPDRMKAALDEASRLCSRKTLLFFTLVFQQSGRPEEAVNWMCAFLAEADIDRLDSGIASLLNAFHTNKKIVNRLNAWVKSIQADSHENGVLAAYWDDRLRAMCSVLPADAYPHLQRHCAEWPALKNALEASRLHITLFDYLTAALGFETGSSNPTYGLDGILTALINAYDEAELPLREKEKMEQSILDCEGDEQRAHSQAYSIGGEASPCLSFTRLLAGEGDLLPPLAVYLGREWIGNAYHDLTQAAQMPEGLTIRIDNFSTEAAAGTGDMPLLDKYYRAVEAEMQAALRQVSLTAFTRYSLYAGGFLGAVGLLVMAAGGFFAGLFILIIGGVMALNYYVAKKPLPVRRHGIEKQYEQKRQKGIGILRGVLAEAQRLRDEHGQNTEGREKNSALLANMQIAAPKAARRKPKAPAKAKEPTH